MLTTRQRRHSSIPKMLQFDLEQVTGFGRLGASNWEIAVVFNCSARTIDRARNQTASGFEASRGKEDRLRLPCGSGHLAKENCAATTQGGQQDAMQEAWKNHFQG